MSDRTVTGKPGVRKVALVTGASGFLGSHLAARLVEDGWAVHAILRSTSRAPCGPPFDRVTYHVHDGTTEAMNRIVAKVEPGMVFHLASQFIAVHGSEHLSPLIQANILFGTQLLDAMRQTGCRYIVNAGTPWQHFHDREYSAVNLYAATKQALEAILCYYVEAEEITAVTLELSDTYGARDPRGKLLSLLKDARKSGTRLQMSPGNQLIDLLHVDDAVAAYLVAARRMMNGECSGFERFSVSSGERLTLRALISLIEETTGERMLIEWGARPYRAREVMEPAKSIPILPDWMPRVRLREGIAVEFGKKS